ncbi:hypothetical protein HAX54_040651 [Datura stramonium]|uniref:Uncharacterized protein n=1 Tax=Datura stramonium TaxID=4076 RepID=A0ABS8Y9A2_DATST|nr:hypothetical protein [Datura stramonium]
MEPKTVTQGNYPTAYARCRPACAPARACVNHLARPDLAPTACPSRQILGHALPSRPAASACRYATADMPTAIFFVHAISVLPRAISLLSLCLALITIFHSFSQALTPALDPTMALATSYCATADTALPMPS